LQNEEIKILTLLPDSPCIATIPKMKSIDNIFSR